MKKINPKSKAIAIAVILTLAMLIPLISLQTAIADPHPYTVKTYAYVEVNPRPVGVGQQAFVTFGIDKVPMTVGQDYGDRWNNLTLIIGYPDGTSKTLTGFVADDTGFYLHYMDTRPRRQLHLPMPLPWRIPNWRKPTAKQAGQQPESIHWRLLHTK